MSGLTPEMADLLESMCLGELSPDEANRLEMIVSADDEQCRHYIRFMYMNALAERFEVADVEQKSQPSESLFPSFVIVSDVHEVPSRHILGAPLPGTVGWFSSGWPVAYLIATVIFGIGLLVGSVVHVSEPVQLARRSPVPGRSVAEPKTELVGRITGMVDCQWVKNPKSEIRNPKEIINQKSQIINPKSLVSLGDRFALASGLMEITYDTGAKVILQGPATYEVESASGGYLSVGKLTARVEGRGARDEGTPNLQISKSPNPSPLSTLPSPLFTIKTPTATVTDLGTEFGVEVSKEGHTTSHVYRGLVRVQVTSGDEKTEGAAKILHENESVRVETGGKQGGNRVAVLVTAGKMVDFVREIPKQTVKILDLVDVVAGGDGFSGRRQAGIDPRSGQVVTTLVEISKPNPLIGDGKYHRVTELPFVDGVFIPCSKNGPVQLDSAGHTFAWFPSIGPYTSGPVWAGKEATNSTVLAGIDYNSPGHAALGLHANKAVTFDLEAIRRASPGWKIVRFRGVAGNTAPASDKASTFADLWVFVDGVVRFQRREITRESGDLPAVVPLGDKDRFLTLAATDGGDGIAWDHTMFGDPRLEMVSVKAATDATSPQEAAAN